MMKRLIYISAAALLLANCGKSAKTPGVEGFASYQKEYEECLDSLMDEELGLVKFTGAISLNIDYYADSCDKNADKVNGFVCALANGSENAYAGSVHDISALSDFVADAVIVNWKRREDFCGFNEYALSIEPRFAGDRYMTFYKYEYEAEDFGHGMYTETFHTLDLDSGDELGNSDIFEAQSLDEVKMRLSEVMAEDAHYREWHDGDLCAQDIQFELPSGALTDTGVLFSFHPYEISGFAAGAFHFIVPYDKLMPYLTPKSKGLIGKN